MYTMSISEVSELKRMLKEKFRMELHFHDGCGGQYFSLDEKPPAELIDYIIEYFSNLGIKVNYTDDFQTFTLDKI